MQRVRVLISGVLVAAGMLGTVVPAMAQGAAVPIEIRAGSCDDPGSAVSSLTEVPRLESAPIGASDAIPASSSFSRVPLALDALTGADHIVLAPSADGDNMLSCGAIGGPPTVDGALIIGLEASGRGGLAGIAYFSPNADPSFTDVSVFLAGRSLTATRASVTSEQPAVAQIVPTAVPTAAAPAMQQGLSADEQAYIDAVMPIISTMSDSLGTFSELSQNPQFGDDDWTLNVAAQLAVWRVSYDNANAIVPPPTFVDLHSLLLESLRLYSEASYDIATGLDNFNVAAMEAGANKMLMASDYLDQANDELNRIRQERGI